MKKLVLISTLMATFAGLSAFGQGYFQFATGKSQVYDGFSTGVAHTATTVDVAFLWAVAGDTPLISSIMSAVPTTMLSSNSTYTAAAAWNDILHDANFTLAVNSASGNSLASVASAANGFVNYNGGTAFAGPSSTSPGVAYALFMIAWDGTYATPTLAAAANGGAGASVGWSAVFAYTPSTVTGIPAGMIGVTPAFGVAGVIPEPATLALVGLGGLSLLLFRRRK
jgi:hypothetical protein